MNEQEQTGKPQEPMKPLPPQQGTLPEAPDPMAIIVARLSLLKRCIGKENALLGMVGGAIVFAVSLFMTWAKAPAGINVLDVGTVCGWSEKGYIAFAPLGVLLGIVFARREAGLKMTLTFLLLAFGLLGFNNVLHKTAWRSASLATNLGSDLGPGFWLGLLAMGVVALCGISWSLHTAEAGAERASTSGQGGAASSPEAAGADR